MWRSKDENDATDGESQKVMVGWPHLLLAAHRSSSFRVGPGAFGIQGEGGCARGEERTTRVPEVSGGYSVITVPSREPTNQTKRDKDKQRFEPTSVRTGERIKRRHAEQTQGRKEGKKMRKRGRERERNCERRKG